MTTLSSISGLGSGATKAPPAAAPQSAIPNELAAKSVAPKQGPVISPRIVIDPSAGVITQYLNSNGDVQAQLPSITAVAYLRAGLARDGHVSHEEGTVA
jgi:hypothetical protein